MHIFLFQYFIVAVILTGTTITSWTNVGTTNEAIQKYCTADGELKERSIKRTSLVAANGENWTVLWYDPRTFYPWQYVCDAAAQISGKTIEAVQHKWTL